MPLKVNIRQLDLHPVVLQGDMPSEELDLDDPEALVHPSGPVRYHLKAQLTGQDILVQGSAQVHLECDCARCLKRFGAEVDLAAWSALVPLEGPEKVEIHDDAVDLTPFLREDILLEFPQHPLCEPTCKGLPNGALAKQKKVAGAPAGPSVWSELNKLKF